MKHLPLVVKVIAAGFFMLSLARGFSGVWVLPGLVGVVLYLYAAFILDSGNVEFWALAAKHPDRAFRHISTSPAWHVFPSTAPPNFAEAFPPEDWVGPFRLNVPGIGRVEFMGRVAQYEESENEFVRTLAGRER